MDTIHMFWIASNTALLYLKLKWQALLASHIWDSITPCIQYYGPPFMHCGWKKFCNMHCVANPYIPFLFIVVEYKMTLTFYMTLISTVDKQTDLVFSFSFTQITNIFLLWIMVTLAKSWMKENFTANTHNNFMKICVFQSLLFLCLPFATGLIRIPFYPMICQMCQCIPLLYYINLDVGCGKILFLLPTRRPHSYATVNHCTAILARAFIVWN